MSRHDPKVTLRQIVENARRAQELCLTGTLAELVVDWRRTWPGSAFRRSSAKR